MGGWELGFFREGEMGGRGGGGACPSTFCNSF